MLQTTDAILSVKAPVHSSIVLTKNDQILFPTIWNQAADSEFIYALFSIPQNQFDNVTAWNIMGKLDNDIVIHNIIIDSNKKYNDNLGLIPRQYQRLNYITFPTGSYIDTDLIPTEKNYAVHFKLDDPTYLDYKHYVGTAADYNTFQFTIHDNTYYWCSGNTPNHNGTWKAGIHEVYYNDIDFNFVPQLNGVALAESATSPQAKFTYIYIGSGNQGQANFSGNFYFCTFKDNATQKIIQDFVPCQRKSDNMVGMWERVSQTFFTNSGSGTFLAGGIFE